MNGLISLLTNDPMTRMGLLKGRVCPTGRQQHRSGLGRIKLLFYVRKLSGPSVPSLKMDVAPSLVLLLQVCNGFVGEIYIKNCLNSAWACFPEIDASTALDDHLGKLKLSRTLTRDRKYLSYAPRGNLSFKTRNKVKSNLRFRSLVLGRLLS